MEPATNLQNNCGSAHNLDCGRNLSEMIFDPTCIRCVKIKHVIALRRKTMKNGASYQENQAAEAIANKIVLTYKLTRGEVMDREYAQEVVVYKQEQAARRQRPRYAKKFSDEDITI